MKPTTTPEHITLKIDTRSVDTLADMLDQWRRDAANLASEGDDPQAEREVRACDDIIGALSAASRRRD